MNALLTPGEAARARASIEEFGFCEIPSRLSGDRLAAMQDEAISAFDTAYHTERTAHALGALSYDAFIADLGSTCRAYLESAELQDLMSSLSGKRFELQADKSCLTYYLGGSFLAPHLDDIDGQAPFSVITYLWAESESGSSLESGLWLNLYADGAFPTERPVAQIPTDEGTIVVGLGTRFWHGRPKLLPNEKVIALTGSFKG